MKHMEIKPTDNFDWNPVRRFLNKKGTMDLVGGTVSWLEVPLREILASLRSSAWSSVWTVVQAARSGLAIKVLRDPLQAPLQRSTLLSPFNLAFLYLSITRGQICPGVLFYYCAHVISVPIITQVQIPIIICQITTAVAFPDSIPICAE